jgi:hypothetical protein
LDAVNLPEYKDTVEKICINQGFGSGSRRAKITHKNRKKFGIFLFLSTRCSLLRAEFPAIHFFSILGHQTLDPDPGSGSGIRIRN